MNILPKLALVSSILILPLSVAHAEPYVGAGFGETMTTFSRSVSFDDDFNGRVASYYSSARVQLLAGYNIHLYQFFQPTPNCTVTERAYLALEVQGNYNGEHAYTYAAFPASSFNMREKINWSYDFIALLKTRITPGLTVFFGPGYSRGQYNVSGTANVLPTALNVAVPALNASINSSTWLSGWTLKMGAELTLTKNLGFVGAYQYTNYGNNSWTRNYPAAGVTVSNRYKPMVNSLTIGLNWYFV